MSALDELKKKEITTDVEECIIWASLTDTVKESAITELLTLRERVEKMAVILQWIYDDGEGGTYRPDIQAVLVSHNQSQ